MDTNNNADDGPLFPPAAAAATSAPAPADNKPDLDGIVTTKSGSIYFGHIAEDEGRIVVTIPTPAGKVRTVRHVAKTNVASYRALKRNEILRLARIGPHLLAKTDVERVVPGSTAPAPAAAATPPPAPEEN